MAASRTLPEVPQKSSGKLWEVREKFSPNRQHALSLKVLGTGKGKAALPLGLALPQTLPPVASVRGLHRFSLLEVF